MNAAGGGHSSDAGAGGGKRPEDIDQQNNQRKEGVMVLTVKTKTEDGGSPTTKENDGSDAFSRYSNMSLQMMQLHMSGMNNNVNAAANNNEGGNNNNAQAAAANNEGANANNTIRRTRLSTELHDGAFFELMMAIDGLQEWDD